MKAVVLEDVGRLAVREVGTPVLKPDELLVRVEACGICGTDRHLFLGEFPAHPPVTLGHEFSGVIEAVGHAVTGFSPGMRVTGDPNMACGRCAQCAKGRVNLCLHLQAIGIHRDGGFAEYVALPQAQAHMLPVDLDPRHGAFCEPLACCLHGVDLARIQVGMSAVVIGGGVIGLLCVQLLRLAGATRIVLVTRSAEKRRLAETMGATGTLDPTGIDAVAQMSGPEGLIPGGADAVFECAGLVETVEQAPKLAARGGRVILLGVLPSGTRATFEPFDLLFREIELVTSFLNPHTHARAAALIASGAVSVAPLITRCIGLEAAAEIIARPAPGGEIRALVVPGMAGERA